MLSGEPSQLYDQANPDWAPSLKLEVTLEAITHTDKVGCYKYLACFIINIQNSLQTETQAELDACVTG